MDNLHSTTLTTHFRENRKIVRALIALLFAFLISVPTAGAFDPPPWLPRYDLNVHIDVEGHHVVVRERVVWTNRHRRPAKSIVFNNHSRYTIPDDEIGVFAKTLEFLRIAPSEAFDFEGPPCQMGKVLLVDPESGAKKPLPFHYLPENNTALAIPLPFEVKQGQSVIVELAFTLRLPQRQGRWGQWRGVTSLAQWLPVLAYYDDRGWQPTPFIPWHQPFHNEAGIYRAKIILPADEKIGCTGSIQSVDVLPNGWKQVQVGDVMARDFAIFCSRHFQEAIGFAGPVKVKCLYLPGHEFYGKETVRIACEAIPIYTKWFGPFPYPEFTVVESFFGWNGNECGGVVMVDERLFGMPHMARNYVDSLLTHEILHQWFYNAVGTDGYAETWMDEGIVTYFTNKVMDLKLGKNNRVLEYPQGLRWLPNIHRGDFIHYGMYGTIARGEATPTVQKMPDYKHLITLVSMNYDRGGRIMGMIEHRLGEAAMLEFMQHIYCKYYFRILHLADFQRELEAYTRQSWQEFFDNWLYGAGMSDWCVEDVDIQSVASCHARASLLQKLKNYGHSVVQAGLLDDGPYRVTVYVRQKGEYTEPTVLGFCMDQSNNYQIRVPVFPSSPVVVLPELNARMETLGKDFVRVTIELPSRPTQISVDPDQVILDREPCNNHWRKKIRFRATPVYSYLDETDVTNAYDRHNVTLGPWVFGATYNDPWYTRTPMIGLRAGVYRTHQYYGGAYVAYRANDRNVVAGVDGLIDHFPHANTQIGFNAEQSLATLGDENKCSRAAIFARYVMLYSSSLYLPPFEYVEVFGAHQNRCLPDPDKVTPGAKLFEERTSLGIHYHKYYLTPYWDPEGGFALDATYQAGLPIFGQDEDFHQVFGQISTVKYMPDPLGILKHSPWLHWLADTRWAFRLYGAAALPDEGQFYSLGGGDMFRGFDLSERQGSHVWIGSVEWRVPLVKGLRKDYIDHVAGLRSIYAVAFYDVGNAYLGGEQTGPIAHAVGGSLRLDVIWLGLIERTMLRLDVAKTVNAKAPVQFWFGIQHPF